MVLHQGKEILLILDTFHNFLGMMNTFVLCDTIFNSVFKAKSNKTVFVLFHRVRPVPSDPLALLDLVEPRYGSLKPPAHVEKLFFSRCENAY